MKVRVVLGSELVRKYQNAIELETLHSGSDYLVQGDSDVVAVRKDGKFRALFAGRLVGKRGGADVLEQRDISHNDIRGLIDSQPTESCMKELEGRFILVKN